MMKIYRLLILLLLALTVSAQVGTWRNLPTLTELRSIFPLQNKVLLASDGGVVSFDKATQTFLPDINGNQTDNLDVNVVYVDSDSLLWVGSRNPGPTVEVYDLAMESKRQIELVEVDEVSSFVQVGDSVYATYQEDLLGGLLLFRKGESKIEYLDQFSNFPNQGKLDLSNVLDVTYHDSRLIFRTPEDILWVELNGTNLKDPTNWHISTIPTGSNEMARMISNGDKVYVAMDDGIYHYDFLTFTQVFLANSAIFDLRVAPDIPHRLVYTTSSGIYEYNISSGLGMLLEGIGGINHIALDGDEIWVVSSIDYFGLLANETYETFSANRPRDHQFNRMIINADGQLVGGAKNGISLYSEHGWRTVRPGDQSSSFNADLWDWNTMIVDTMVYKGNAIIEDMISDREGNLFFSLQGKGVLRTDENLLGEGQYYNADDGVLEATYDSQAKTFILPGQMAVDSENNVWVTTKLIKEGGTSLTILGAEDQVYHLNHNQDGMDSRSVKSIAVDQNDYVWTGSQVWEPIQAIGGIHFINRNGTLGTNTEFEISFLSGSPLASNEILQLSVDSQNTLWILTTSGVQSMALPDRWLTSQELRNWANLYMTPKTAEDYYYWQLTDYNVTGIEIDQRGNRWFLSSNSGVHVLQSNGRWINNGFGYNTENSDLLDNQVFSIAFDAVSGQTYFSTPKGISILNTPFADPKEDYSDMHIYPQPFNPNLHDKVVVQGLMDNSSVKILTISGTMVRELSSSTNEVQGYEAQWDGRDSQGDMVGSGVYILYIYNEDGVASSQKVAVLR